MTGASEQGKSGILWTIFEGEPFCSRRIASFSDRDEAWDYMNLKQSSEDAFEKGVQSVLSIRCKKHYTIPMHNTNEFSGGECGGCIIEELEAVKAELASLTAPPLPPENNTQP